MKNGTYFGKRIRQAFSKWRSQFGKPEIPEAPTPPMEQLMVALISREGSTAAARTAWSRVAERMVDLNEVRVSFPDELAAVFSAQIPNALACAERIQAALNAVFRKRHTLDLDYLHKLGRKEAEQHLASLDGVDPQSVASVMLWSLGGHAIPVNELLLKALRDDGLVDTDAGVEEVQGFLERHIQASEAKEFVLLAQQFVHHRKAGKAGVRSAGSGGNHKARATPAAKPARSGGKHPAGKSAAPTKTRAKVGSSRPQSTKRGR